MMKASTSSAGQRASLVSIGLAVALFAAFLAATPGPVAEPADSPFLGYVWESAEELAMYEPKTYTGSMYWVAQEITGAGEYWNNGFTGAGVDVAIVDTGVVAVDGLTYPGKVINGPDLSFESQSDTFRYLDTYGHGTHLAGIIAGRDDAASIVEKGDEANFLGMAPGARLLNVKVAGHDGAVDVSQVIAAIDWIVQHKNDNGMDVRVINLAYGTDSVQDHEIDPLSYAVERAWKAGIVVVVAAGNDGNASPLRNPAVNPYVITVGASEGNETYSASDDTLADFSSCGTRAREVDVVAPGKSVVSLRNPGSRADIEYPSAVVEDRFFLGSGTSQAAAVVSGAAALIIEQRPGITPDEVKALLMDTAQPLPGVSSECQGAGLIDLKVARDSAVPRKASQDHPLSDGSGSIEAARGSDHVEFDGVVLTGEQDIMGSAWDGYTETVTTCREEKVKGRPTTVCSDEVTSIETLWDGGDFNGTSWSGTSWSGTSWSGTSWSGTSWSGTSWSGTSWSGTSWSNQTWTGTSWSGTSWSGTSWSGTSWSGTSWSGLSWGRSAAML